MSLAKQLFRESALERLSSPEQLDQLLQVTSPRGWVALIAIWGILGTVIAWSILGTVPTIEEGRGILVAGGGLRQVVALGSGRLRSIKVGIGDQITTGQVIADIEKQDIADQLTSAQQQLTEVRTQQEALAEFDSKEERLQESLAAVETERLSQTVEFSKRKLDRLQRRHDRIAEEVKKGQMIDVDVDRVDEEIEATQTIIEQSQLQIRQLVAKNNNATFQRERERMNRQLKADELARTVDNLQSKLDREAKVIASFSGRVVEVRAALHSAVAVGDPIFLVEPLDAALAGETGDLKAILYVSAATGKRIGKLGMEVELSPSTVKREEFGSLKGTVSFVAGVPTSKSAMMTVLSDRDLVEKFTQEIGLPLQVEVKLIPDPKTPSGFQWTSSTGPPIKISAGTLCSGSITVKRQSPISLVIPIARRWANVD